MQQSATLRAKFASSFISIVLAANSVVLVVPRAAMGQTPLSKQQQKELAEQIEKRTRIPNHSDNGIFVDDAKVYDDSSLQLMLNTARARLAAIQTLDQAGLLSKIGAISGASLTQTGISAQVLGPPIPQIATTALGATGSTDTTTSGTSVSTVQKVGQPVENVTTTSPQLLASAPAVPQSALTLPSAYSVSALDALNEQMQLTYEIANLQLLLEGSLNDRYVKNQRLLKPRTTLGFPITITPQRAYRDAVAVVEVEVWNPKETLAEEPPAVTALLPREKTYNVAAVTDRMTSIGGGLVTHVISGGFSLFRGRKSFYVVQDQDTVAIMRRASDDTKATAFSWEFRPVLGQPFVRPGMKQTFVQLAAPIPISYGCFGQVRIRTYWRKVDRKTGVLKEVIAESISGEMTRSIRNFDLTPVVENADYDDLGAGQLRVTVEGRFLAGTYVRVGNQYHREGTVGFTSELTRIRFVAAAADIAKYKAYIVSRDGTETEIRSAGDPKDLGPVSQTGCERVEPPVGDFQIAQENARRPRMTVNVSAFDDSRSIVTAVMYDLLEGPRAEDYVMIINDKVLGLADAPIERMPLLNQNKPIPNALQLRAVVSNSLLNGAGEVAVRPLLWETRTLKAQLSTWSIENAAEKILVLNRSEEGTRFLLYGSRLNETSIIIPENVKLHPLPGGDPSTLRIFFLNKDQVSNVKEIVLQKTGMERPVFVRLPDAAPKPVLTVDGRVTTGTDELVVTGDIFDNLKSVKFGKKTINRVPGESNKSVRLTGLVGSDVTKNPGKPELQFEWEDGRKNTLKLDVVNGKVEIVERDKL